MNALELNHLTKTFPGFMLDDLTLTLPTGCIMGLIGENGAGKTTTIQLILDMLRPDRGSIRLLGQDAQTHSTLLKEDIGVVLDEVGIPECLTASQVGTIMKYTYQNWEEATYQELLRKLALPEHKPFRSFSRGMKMKLGIAIAMSHGAKLLILDEATSGLDPVVRDEVLELFSEFTRDETHSILISSHIISDLEKLCDYVAFLHRGKLILCEEKDQLLAEYGLIHCTEEQLEELPPEAIRYRKATPYSVEALVLRDAIPSGIPVSPVSIEDLFISMAKEAQ